MTPTWKEIESEWVKDPEFVASYNAEYPLDPIELPDADINPDEAEPLPPEEPVKTDPVPEEPQ